MSNLDVIRTLKIQIKTEGEQAAEAALNRVAAAEGKVATATGGLTSASVTHARVLGDTGKAYDRVLRQVDATYAAEQKYARAHSVTTRAFETGRISIDQHNRTLELAASKYKVANDNAVTFGKTHELASHQVQNLRFQLQDVATSLAGGASPLQVLAQQGGQIAGIFGPGQGGVLGILRGISQAIPRGLALGGAASSAVGIPLLASERYQRDEQENRRSVLGVGRGSGITGADIEDIAGKPYALQGGLSVSQTRDLARSVASTGYGSREAIEQARDMARDLSSTLGESLGDTNKRFATLFKDPVAGADALNDRLGFLTGSTRDYIKSLADQGRNTEAAQAAMRAMAGTLGKYTELAGPTAKAFDTAKGAISDFFFTVERGGDRVVTSLTDTAKKHEETADRVVRAEQRQTQAVKDATDEQVRRIRDRAEVVTATLERENLLARRDPLAQQAFVAQREAGVQPPLTERDREAEKGLTAGQRAERQRQADMIAGQVIERNTIDLSKAFAEQARASRLTLEGETAAIGLNVLASERLRYEMAARIAAGQGGKAISQETEAQIRKEAAAYGELADRLARARMGDQVRFDRDQLGRTSADAQVASQIRSAGLGSMDDAANQAAVSQLRLNQTLSETKSLAKDSLSGLISDLRSGKSGAEAFSNALSRINDRLIDKALDSVISSAFKPGGGLVGGSISSVFGTSAPKEKPSDGPANDNQPDNRPAAPAKRAA